MFHFWNIQAGGKAGRALGGENITTVIYIHNTKMFFFAAGAGIRGSSRNHFYSLSSFR